ncbi:MAG: hypothetical protein K0U93_22750, partial [Gammaproteobacteria bacterium]|nr:hypothetical protein [Gammaproteobacteria bacterium]
MGISTSLKTSALAPRALWRGLVIVACLALAQQSAAVSFPDKPPNSSFYVDSASIIELEQGQG